MAPYSLLVFTNTSLLLVLDGADVAVGARVVAGGRVGAVGHEGGQALLGGLVVAVGRVIGHQAAEGAVLLGRGKERNNAVGGSGQDLGVQGFGRILVKYLPY